MDRKEFLKTCAGGLCGCAAACLTAPTETLAAEAAKPEDWRLPFVKQRYAKLLEILSQRMGNEGASGALRELGSFCASQRDEITDKFRGNVDGYRKFLGEHGTNASYDAKRGVYTLVYDPGPACSCTLAGEAGKTPGVMCDCSVGWARHTWGIVLEREPKVELKEAFLRGGKVCKFEITPV